MSRAFDRALFHGTLAHIDKIDVTQGRMRNYWRGLFGAVGSLKAKQTLLEVLEPENLGVQCCLCTPKAVEQAVMSMNLVDWKMFA